MWRKQLHIRFVNCTLSKETESFLFCFCDYWTFLLCFFPQLQWLYVIYSFFKHTCHPGFLKTIKEELSLGCLGVCRGLVGTEIYKGKHVRRAVVQGHSCWLHMKSLEPKGAHTHSSFYNFYICLLYFIMCMNILTACM